MQWYVCYCKPNTCYGTYSCKSLSCDGPYAIESLTPICHCNSYTCYGTYAIKILSHAMARMPLQILLMGDRNDSTGQLHMLRMHVTTMCSFFFQVWLNLQDNYYAKGQREWPKATLEHFDHCFRLQGLESHLLTKLWKLFQYFSSKGIMLINLWLRDRAVMCID